MKTEVYKLYSRVFGIFLPNFIKIAPCNFELYRFKVKTFSLRHSVVVVVVVVVDISKAIWEVKLLSYKIFQLLTGGAS